MGAGAGRPQRARPRSGGRAAEPARVEACRRGSGPGRRRGSAATGWDPIRRRATMSTTAVGRLVRAELKLMTRDPLVLTFVFAFPVVTMLIIGGAFGTAPDAAF